MSPLPDIPTTTGESWEIVESTRSRAADQIDRLVEALVACECEHTPDGLEHFDVTHTTIHRRFASVPAVFPSLLAEAVTRLAAARKAAEQ